MLRSIKELEHYAVCALDGTVGRTRDFLFDDDSWVVRYLVVDSNDLDSRQTVLISPIAFNTLDGPEKILPLAITRAQVAASPDIDSSKPVSRQQEQGYLGYYGYGTYWGGSGLWGGGLYPDMLQGGLDDSSSRVSANQHSDPHLRSCNTAMKYYVHAQDGDIGHVQGMLIDDRTWAIRYIVVDTSNWFLGHKVLIAPEWIDNIEWRESRLNVLISRQAVKDAPKYDPTKALDGEEEHRMDQHYGREAYRPRGDRLSQSTRRSRS